MRNDTIRLHEVAQAADRIHSVDQLTAEVAQAAAAFGVSSVSVNLIVTAGRVLKPGILTGRGWKEWSARYGREGLSRNDPAVRMLRAQTRPFTWAEAVERYGSVAAARVMDACRETTGASEALVVPVRETDGALLSAAFCGERIELDPEARAAMHLVGYYYATRGRELVQGIGLEVACPLTPRQIQCLQWVLVAKTDEEIGVILGISPNTVHRHVELAKEKMKATKRGQAAHEAWRRGWLD